MTIIDILAEMCESYLIQVLEEGDEKNDDTTKE